ncbi:MAG TPA: hypothetical protein VKV15_24605 [Bryobacteraceae bacterium]|nr:hypothetical protein [Bryobacteraceae bacterium]
MAFQQGAVIAEEKMVPASNLYECPSILRQTIVNRLHISQDLMAFRVGLMGVIAEKKHEWPIDAPLNDAAV